MDPTAPLSTELVYLAWSVVLLVVQVALQGGLGTAELGISYNAGPRDAGKAPQSDYARRADRALRNLLETYPAFIALALALAVTGKVGGIGAIGAALWFWSRVVYVPLYMLGIPFLRTLAFVVSAIGLVLMLIRLMG